MMKLGWDSTTKSKEIKYPRLVFHYLKDVMHYKIETIRIKMPLGQDIQQTEGWGNAY